MLALLLVTVARPQRTNEQVEQWSEGIDIALVLDISESMKIEDFKPNRLEAAKVLLDPLLKEDFKTALDLSSFREKLIP